MIYKGEQLCLERRASLQAPSTTLHIQLQTRGRKSLLPCILLSQPHKVLAEGFNINMHTNETEGQAKENKQYFQFLESTQTTYHW